MTRTLALTTVAALSTIAAWWAIMAVALRNEPEIASYRLTPDTFRPAAQKPGIAITYHPESDGMVAVTCRVGDQLPYGVAVGRIRDEVTAACLKDLDAKRRAK